MDITQTIASLILRDCGSRKVAQHWPALTITALGIAFWKLYRWQLHNTWVDEDDFFTAVDNGHVKEAKWILEPKIMRAETKKATQFTNDLGMPAVCIIAFTGDNPTNLIIRDSGIITKFGPQEW